MILGRLNVSRRILLVLAIGVATPAFLTFQSLSNVRQGLLDARAAEVRHLDEGAWSVVADYYGRFAKGLMSEDAAKEAARNTVRAMHYDGTNYFFIWDLSGVGVAHGGNPTLEGKNFLMGQDAANSPGVADMVGKLVKIAREQNEGFASYRIPKSGQTEPLDKIGYSKLFAPWGWAVGTGAYVTDISAVFWAQARSDLIIATILTLLAGVCSYVLGRDLSQALKKLTTAMKAIAAGSFDAAIPVVDRQDEVGVMARTVQVFKESSLRARDLEREKFEAQSHRAAEDDRLRREAEHKAAAEAAELVVHSIGTGLERLAACDLTYQLSTELPTAYEKLRTDLNHTTTQLRHLIQGIVANASKIRTGSGEIARSADDLSRRTEQQAASLEETAAALDEITMTVRSTAESSGKARVVVASAKEDAQRTGTVVQDAVGAMGAIENSAAQIGQIISVIDEIAFQTNLLALNAGVEAARAGEAGRGFAVVASEVRALAQRSAEAAKEIKALVGSSTQKVAQGVKLVGETGRALGRIVEQVGEISLTIETIAASAQEQATGLQEVNIAVNQMDQVTQQNAAMVEQSTATSRDLLQEVEALTSMTSQFRVGGNGERSFGSAATTPSKPPRSDSGPPHVSRAA